ncbi:universal stress protein [Shewanella sp. AS16]|uniref:universal stress protein n=1 Tax=Shewanella sp. AS16 TaxID=2907625 RepID=UPI001F44B0EC|nr:universal stress protein [Shewanella sp. AS16]MCE9686442.1 universal stress protein [Shewanella sp. AS16]
MKNFLVIADKPGEPQSAFLKAKELARTSGAKIHLAAFCYEPGVDISDPEINGPLLKQRIMLELQNWWQGFIDTHAGEQSVNLEVIWQKNLYEWILASCQSHQYDLIIKTGHRSEGMFYTPTDWLLFRDAPIPVYIVAKEQFNAKKRVLVALDVLAKSADKQALNAQLLECAFRLAVQTDAELHCAYAIKVPTLLKDLDLVDPHAYAHKIMGAAQANMARLVEDYDISPDCIHIEEGEPWGAIARLAKRLHSQCLVVGSMGHKGLMGKLIGNMAEKIIHVTNTDLLVISPEVKVKIAI